jgi:hypothetical protein
MTLRVDRISAPLPTICNGRQDMTDWNGVMRRGLNSGRSASDLADKPTKESHGGDTDQHRAQFRNAHLFVGLN